MNDKQQYELVKKITASVVWGGDLPRHIKEPITIMRVIGQANDYEIVSSQYGDSTRYKGQFLATNLANGKCFRGGQLFLPSLLDALIFPQLEGLGEDKKSVEFAFDIGLKPDAKSSTGYQYTAVPLIAPKESDPLERLAATLPAPVIKSLPVTEKQPEKPAVKSEPAAKK